MHRFLGKKNGDAASSPLSPPTTSSKKWKKNKKDVVEEKPELDLGSALPSIDDFRTSLIMPNLSTRFSMLREQDDPNSLLGKASDDSVLQPQRNSRLLDFGFSSNNLNDIAEVASINSSIRPPFALDRTGSFASEEGYGTDNNSNPDGSVMSRARPGEGNVLFGGRQKVYKIATGSAKSIGGNSERGMGRMVYDDDLNMSAFQKYRQQERERLLAMGADWDSDSALLSPETDPEHRASDDLPKGLGLSGTETGFSFLKRNSDSTTNSIPSQDLSASTATSVASQSIGTAISTPATVPKTSPNPTGPGLERSMTKRRLYEQGLNQHIQDQQASTISRLNSINQRQRAPTLPSALNHSRSIGNLQDRRAYKPYALNNTTTSPQLRSGMAPLNTLVSKVASSTSSPTVSSYPQSPISPVIPETEEYQVLQSALEQSDHGKATALGMFNKPAQQFDEQQYLKRQIQMGQAKSESPIDTPVKLSPVSQSETPPQVQAEQPPLSKFSTREGATSRQASVEHNPQDSRAAHFDSIRQNNFSRASQRSRSRSVSKAGSIATTAPEPPVNAALAVFQRAAMQNRVAHGDSPEQAAVATFDNNNRTFFGDSDDEDKDESYAPSAPAAGRYGATYQPPASQHPALRNDYLPEVDEEEEEEERKGFPFPEPSINIASTEAGAEDIDSPTIGVHEGIGGMISQHLRNRSDTSSIYPPHAPYADRASTVSRNTYSDRRLSGNSSAWNIDELDNYYGDIPSRISTNSATTASQGQGLHPLPLKTNGSRPSTSDDNVGNVPWHPAHNRDASTATQAEREAFANELEARKKAIQEKMKSIVESESRGPSPGPSASGALKAFGMLKSRPSQETMNLRQTNSSRLGLGLSGAHPAERNPSYEDKLPQSTNAGAQWPLGPGPIMPSARQQADSEIGRTPLQQARERSRNRSGSDASRARSRSRNRGEIGTAVSVGADAPPAMPAQRPSPEINQYRSPSTEPRGRLRSNSRAAGLHPSARPSIGPSPSQSPASFNSVMSPPLGTTSSVSRPPLPKQAPAVLPSVPLGKPRGELLRKKTINKFDISEPTLVSSTSNIDTVDLPPGASLKNGMDEIYAIEQAAVVSRRRKLFGFGRDGSSDREKTPDSVTSPPLNGFSSPPMRPIVPSFGSQEHMGSRKPSAEAGAQHPPLRVKQSFETSHTQHTTHTAQTAASSARFDAIGSPVLNEAGMF
ncbi:hypothetical protein KCU91_g3129, partial [Aureobasidium melanogenum]